MDFYLFPGTILKSAELSQVGGKGYSLIAGSASGLPVPPGFVLTVSFFSSWLEELKKSEEWKQFLQSANANNGDLDKKCAKLKKLASKLTLSAEQKETLEKALSQIPFEGSYKGKQYAVRSSSPEEDLEGSSFAGGYETILGVTYKSMENAIARAFASCLDLRIVVYKRQHGFDITDPKIAVVVQEQIASEVSGVGFSMNPVNNNLDEAVFNANWGLGETVVAGLVTPDFYRVNKVSMSILEKTLGSKETSIWLNDNGTETKENHRSDEFTLDNRHVGKLALLVKQVERIYKKPIDIEWAFANEKLYLLQARPITTFTPVPPDMMTGPGERKRLYLDLTIAAQGMPKPMSTMGSSILTYVPSAVGNILHLGRFKAGSKGAIVSLGHGRIYVNVSILLGLAGKKKFIELFSNMDPLAGKIVNELDEDTYKDHNPLLGFVPVRLATVAPLVAPRIMRARLQPQKALMDLKVALERFEFDAQKLADSNKPLPEFTKRLLKMVADVVFMHCVPLVVTSRVALSRMKELAKNEPKEVLDQLELALPGNVTTEMSLDLYKVSQLLPESAPADFNSWLASDASPEFKRAWWTFLEKYGFRGPAEVDIASPRYYDDPQMLVDLMKSMRKQSIDNPEQSQVSRFAENERKRRDTFKRLSEEIGRKNWFAKQEFKSLYKIVESIGGIRETHKYYLIYALHLLRLRLRREGEELVDTGRLNAVDDIFDLTIAELDRGIKDKTVDLKSLVQANRKERKKLDSVTEFPVLIDSRGFIPRLPAPPVGAGEVAGIPISAGVVRGKVKTLRTPDEKPFEKGEILVARATDPGWTPLFVNAAGVILEVGGVLQHGALVAREYGLPCVAGIPKACEAWEDGTLVEVDGSTGIVRRIESIPVKVQ
ncbi:MAG: hypothetical protein KIT34_14770 [Cyanobacteria bacterium TGS_CYA1]|nr:hypothetical protein [Cyanobacteria bacterium TGS_CYA1]